MNPFYNTVTEIIINGVDLSRGVLRYKKGRGDRRKSPKNTAKKYRGKNYDYPKNTKSLNKKIPIIDKSVTSYYMSQSDVARAQLR